MLRITEAAKRLGVTPATLRRWEEEGLIIPDRTAGGERRYHEGELDQLEARIASGSLIRKKRRLGNSRRAAAKSIVDDEIEEESPIIPPAPPTAAPDPPPWERVVYEARADLEVKKIQREKRELERIEREAEEARSREAQDVLQRKEEENARDQAQAREEQRLASLRSYGETKATFSGAPIEYKAAITRDLAKYVSAEQFPPSLALWQAWEYLDARVEQLLKPWRVQKAKEHAAAERRRAYDGLLSLGRSHANSRTSNWNPEDAIQARQEVERELKEEVGSDWTRQEVVDLVEEILEEWEDV
jgi:DNA-binding transcriptional MerR regulator